MIVPKGKFAEQSNGLEEVEDFVSPIETRRSSTYTPATAGDYKSGLLTYAFIFGVFNVAQECRDNGEVLWSAGLGTKG